MSQHICNDAAVHGTLPCSDRGGARRSSLCLWDGSPTVQHMREPCVCGAQLEKVYGEVLRVLKPGAFFATYEWVATKDFDPANPDHQRIIDEINYGNGLPVCPGIPLPHRTRYIQAQAWRECTYSIHVTLSVPRDPLLPFTTEVESSAGSSCVTQEMRTFKQAEDAGKNVGFELVLSIDIAAASPVAGPWCAAPHHQVMPHLGRAVVLPHMRLL